MNEDLETGKAKPEEMLSDDQRDAEVVSDDSADKDEKEQPTRAEEAVSAYLSADGEYHYRCSIDPPVSYEVFERNEHGRQVATEKNNQLFAKEAERRRANRDKAFQKLVEARSELSDIFSRENLPMPESINNDEQWQAVINDLRTKGVIKNIHVDYAKTKDL